MKEFREFILKTLPQSWSEHTRDGIADSVCDPTSVSRAVFNLGRSYERYMEDLPGRYSSEDEP